MSSSDTTTVSLSEFLSWSALPNIGVVVIDSSEINRWCNRVFADFVGKPPHEVAGIRPHDWLTEEALAERRRHWMPLFKHGERVAYDQVLGGRRVRTTGAILAPEVMGPMHYVFFFVPVTSDAEGSKLPLLSTAVLAEFSRLSRAELRVLQAFAQGLTRDEIAAGTHRSLATVQEHMKSIYAKTGTHREVDLALKLGQSGLGSISTEEWERIVMTVPAKQKGE